MQPDSRRQYSPSPEIQQNTLHRSVSQLVVCMKTRNPAELHYDRNSSTRRVRYQPAIRGLQQDRLLQPKHLISRALAANLPAIPSGNAIYGFCSLPLLTEGENLAKPLGAVPRDRNTRCSERAIVLIIAEQDARVSQLPPRFNKPGG